METVSHSINRNDELIKQTLLLMGFKNIVSSLNNGDIEEYVMDFGPGLSIKMIFVKGFHDVQVRYWHLLISEKNNNRRITDICYDRGETESSIISDVFLRMLLRTEIATERLIKDQIKTLIA